VRHMKAADLLLWLQEYNLAWRDLELATMLNLPDFHDTKTTYPTLILSHVHTPHTQHFKQFRHSTLWKPCTHVHTPHQVTHILVLV
jgi:hypothetical protein